MKSIDSKRFALRSPKQAAREQGDAQERGQSQSECKAKGWAIPLEMLGLCIE